MLITSILLLSAQQATVAETTTASDIRAADLRSHIGFLASDELEGRESGLDGGHKAANYVESNFRRVGLKPLANQKGAYQISFELRRQGLTCNNVVGVLPGTNPDFADKYIAIGGHHDHAGIGGPGAMGFPGEIHNGADDNASGTSGVLELAEYYAANPLQHPIIFMTFSAEERGLLGSKALVDSNVLENDKILFMINLDMIGRMQDDNLFVGGLGTAQELHPLLDPVFAKSELKLELDDRGEAPSDNTSFFHAGIPALFFFTNIHEDYHMPGDDADKINYDGEVQVLNLVDQVVRKLDTVNSLEFVDYGGMGMPADFEERMTKHYRTIMQRSSMKGKLGIRANVEGSILTINSVSESSAAAEAGLKIGDELLEVNGKTITSMKDLRIALGGGLRGDEIKLVVMRAGSKQTLSATLK
ncbi:MAG: M28 family peptidase [Planctomycetota bacterium]|nr:M28 family peptidase [Planctomycetota bacterium]